MRQMSDYLVPIPDYAVGTSILVVDPEMASLMQTGSILEEASYRVTITQFPDEALSFLQERRNEYDLIVAAVNMQGMDCLTFLTSVKTLRNIPVVLTSCGMDLYILQRLSMSSIRHGASQFYEKPLSRDDAYSLWQLVYSRGKKMTAPDVIDEEHGLNQSDNSDKQIRDSDKVKGKNIALPAKEIQQGTQKRKRSDYGNREKKNDDTKRNSEAPPKKAKNSDKNPIRWNSELHAMFMKILAKDRKKATAAPAQQEFGTMNTTLQAQTSTKIQNFQGGGYSNSATVPSTRYAREELQSIPYINSTTGAENGLHGTLRPTLCPGSQVLGASKQNFGKDISHFGAINGASSINQTSLLLNNHDQLAVNNSTDNESYLKGRINQIRHAYWANIQTGNESFMPNYGYYGLSSSNMGFSPPLNVCPPHQVQSCASSGNYFQSFMESYGNLPVETTTVETPNYSYSDCNYNSLLPSDNLANQAVPADDLGTENLVDFGVMYSSEQVLNNAGASNILQPTEDDMYFDGMLAELQNDYANNDLRSLGFDTSNVQ